VDWSALAALDDLRGEPDDLADFSIFGHELKARTEVRRLLTGGSGGL